MQLIEKYFNRTTAAIEAIGSIHKEQSEGYRYCQYVLKDFCSLALLNQVRHEINLIKETKRIVPIAEFNRRIAQVVQEPVPFIYDRVGVRFQHYLIDEFQDTSILQWQNFLPLIDNALSEGNFAMLVGDAKQSIYRFRAGEVEQFSALPALFKPEGTQKTPLEQQLEHNLINAFEAKKLDTNYRSQATIVDFNNRLFEECNQKYLQKMGFDAIYLEQEQKSLTKNDKGLVRIELIEEDNDSLKKFKDICTEKTLDCIKNLVQNEGFEPKDICLLVLTNSEGNTLGKYLVEHDIDVISSDSLFLASHQYVQFMVSMFEYLNNGLNTIAKNNILHFLKHEHQKTITDAQMMDLSVGKTSEFNKKLIELGYDFKIRTLKNLPIYELAETIVRVFDLNPKGDNYLQAILDLIHQFSEKIGGTMEHFLQYWTQKKEKHSLQMPENANAVRVMTIHKAKGLQFPVVIIPFCDWETLETKKATLWKIDHQNPNIKPLNVVALGCNKDMEKIAELKDLYNTEKNKTFLDALNMLYVAFTRPEERLYVFTHTKPYKENDIPHSKVSKIIKNFIEYNYPNQLRDNVLELGITTRPQKTPKNTNQQQKINYLHSKDWQGLIQMTENSRQYWNSTTKTEELSDEDLLYRLLTTTQTHADLPKNLQKLVFEGWIAESKKTELEQRIKHITNQTQLKPYFDGTFITRLKSNIILDDKSVFLADRLVANANQLTIIVCQKKELSKKEKQELSTLKQKLGNLHTTFQHTTLLVIDLKTNSVETLP